MMTPDGSTENAPVSVRVAKRSIITPGTRINASATDLSGKSPNSSAVMESITVLAFLFNSWADSIFRRIPETTISSISSSLAPVVLESSAA